jgi:hypothetical protein
MGCVRPRQIFHPFYYQAQFRPTSHHVVIAFIFALNATGEGIPSLVIARRRVVALGPTTRRRQKNPPVTKAHAFSQKAWQQCMLEPEWRLICRLGNVGHLMPGKKTVPHSCNCLPG